MSQCDRQFLNALRKDLVSQIEAHNPSRKGHADRVSVYAVATGFELGIREDNLFLLRFLSAVHDFWKLQVKSEILEKPEPLSPEEKPNVYPLCENAAREIHDRIQHPLSVVLRLLYFWHDGSQPPSISQTREAPEENLPRLLAQCIYVSVVYDVLVNDQPWRKSIPEEDAVRQIKNASGSQFCPDVVNAFLRVQPLIQPLKNV